MKRLFLFIIIPVFLLMGNCAAGINQIAHTPGEHRLNFKAVVEKRVDLRYNLYLPQGYGEDPEKQWPLILFLHGAGERGNDLEMVKYHGLNKMLLGRPDFPFILVSPLCAEESWWTEHLDGLDALLDAVIDTLAVDEDRVYLTGLSMGGQGAWHLAIRYPERFAAIAPICGWGQTYLACNLKDVPIWAFHGGQDRTVPPAQSEQMVAAVNKCGGNAKLTIYPEAGHDSWTATFSSPELYAWFLEHSR
jgi:predicted peptidase